MKLRRSVWLAGAFLGLALLAAAGAWLRDEAPTAEVRSWLTQVQGGARQSAAYLYLAGLDAPAEQAPQQLGALRLAAYQDWLTQRAADQPPPATRDVLPLPEGDLLCPIETPGCFARLLADGQLQAFNDAHGLLRQRYEQFLALDDYRTLHGADISAPTLPLAYLLKGQQLFDLHVLHVAQQGDGQTAGRLLATELRGLRQHLRRADNLIVKISLARLVERNLQWQALLYRHGLLLAVGESAPVELAERSLLQSLQHEFAGVAQMFAGLRDDPQADWGERLQLRLWFKPQMTINAALPPYLRVAELSQLEPDAFVEALPQAAPMKPRIGWRNRVGDILLSIGGPDLRLYAARLQDIEARRRLLLLIGALPPGPLEAAKLEALAGLDNPYFPGQPAVLDEQGRLCFVGPRLQEDPCLLL
ncbi:hypothetical protein [Ectopseudomonas hydrolytica]|uniref:hypothetical protein n=1 Tax=Ectopseudomonas hydrolytica TaxID=2493633 RepID=UPI003C2FA7A8